MTEQELPEGTGILRNERRVLVRRAIGSDLLGRLNAATAPWVRSEIERVPLIEGSAFEDLKQEWVSKPIPDVLLAAYNVLSLDIDDNDVLGSNLRPSVTLVAQGADRIVELRTFVDRFEGDPGSFGSATDPA